MLLVDRYFDSFKVYKVHYNASRKPQLLSCKDAALTLNIREA